MAAAALDDQRSYEAEIQSWRRHSDERLRAADGWLTLTGLYWLHVGGNTLGSDPASDILLPGSAPKQVGTIDFDGARATLRLISDARVDEVEPKVAPLLDDADPHGPTRIEIGSITFFVIQRGDQYGVRVRDRSHPTRLNFPGRQWYPIDPAYRVVAPFTAYAEPRILPVPTVAGVVTPTANPGYAEFDLGGQHLHFEAFEAGEGEVWFVFKDASLLNYPGGRFLYAPLAADGTVVIDFNKAYNPPCAFTVYATCPLPPKENIVSIPIEVGEKAPSRSSHE